METNKTVMRFVVEEVVKVDETVGRVLATEATKTLTIYNTTQGRPLEC